ncbi:Uu.00g025640.m01.CDS01 [Anthostomella pinea]|uniref:Uu.00g025640.m01.CDS01 n=1 Tax=Anthostomella pinea TaxID=933095 RepID=A0AAI8YCF6_9PEZI|nr:Uu.00g025640.m01.CDS01 [Anthostomella pinea]
MTLEANEGRLFFAPAAPIGHHPQGILDLGTGTGVWVMEMADKCPSAEVLGINLGPIQPDLPHHIANSCLTMDPVKQLRDVFERAGLGYRRVDGGAHPKSTDGCSHTNLKPSAWLELQDVDGMVHCDDGTLPPDLPVLVFTNLMVEALKFRTKSHAAVFGGQYLAECRFVNIGTWPKDT